MRRCEIAPMLFESEGSAEVVELDEQIDQLAIGVQRSSWLAIGQICDCRRQGADHRRRVDVLSLRHASQDPLGIDEVELCRVDSLGGQR